MMILLALIISIVGGLVLYNALTTEETLKYQKYRGIIIGIVCMIMGLAYVLQAC